MIAKIPQEPMSLTIIPVSSLWPAIYSFLLNKTIVLIGLMKKITARIPIMIITNLRS